MKTHFVLLAFAAMAMAGCATETTTTSNAADPSQRTYTQKDLSNTGRHDSADALRAADPSVTVSSGR
jgi:outer membrane biogenesis lipoprotein LolB